MINYRKPWFICPVLITEKNFFFEFSPVQKHLAWTKFCFWSGQKQNFLVIGPGPITNKRVYGTLDHSLK